MVSMRDGWICRSSPDMSHQTWIKMMRPMHHRTTRLMAVSWAPLSIAASFFCGGKRTVQLPALSVDVRGVLGAVITLARRIFARWACMPVVVANSFTRPDDVAESCSGNMYVTNESPPLCQPLPFGKWASKQWVEGEDCHLLWFLA